jgi:hypothetical protein
MAPSKEGMAIPEKFPLGSIVATSGALEALERAGQASWRFLGRHAAGDWGEVSDADRQENEVSLTHGFRLLSVYRTRLGEKIWVMTEADRSATIVLLPDEY